MQPFKYKFILIYMKLSQDSQEIKTKVHYAFLTNSDLRLISPKPSILHEIL